MTPRDCAQLLLSEHHHRGRTKIQKAYLIAVGVNLALRPMAGNRPVTTKHMLHSLLDRLLLLAADVGESLSFLEAETFASIAKDSTEWEFASNLVSFAGALIRETAENRILRPRLQKMLNAIFATYLHFTGEQMIRPYMIYFRNEYSPDTREETFAA